MSKLEMSREAVLGHEAFRTLLFLERRRAERSRKAFILMLIASTSARNGTVLEQLARVLPTTVRESDLLGWYERQSVLGVIFTEVNWEGPIIDTLKSKILNALGENLDASTMSKISVTFHQFPENWGKGRPDGGADIKLYPDLREDIPTKRVSRTLKRAIDIAGSGALLLVLAPLLALIALAIRLTSRGPVIFRQERLGQFGKRFQLLKFRTMYVNSDPEIHRNYVQDFIAGRTNGRKHETGSRTIFKITSDPRVTWMGRLLRKTSLDELPQFWNVLRGEMSLVGPRPPLIYEFEAYDFWHRRRVLEVKPGVTGLWQVNGRSRTCFDDMVRLDLRYSQEWSLWLDLKILLATPYAVFSGDGAF